MPSSGTLVPCITGCGKGLTGSRSMRRTRLTVRDNAVIMPRISVPYIIYRRFRMLREVLVPRRRRLSGALIAVGLVAALSVPAASPTAGTAREGQSDLHVQQVRPRAAPLPVRPAGGEGRLLHELVRCDDDVSPHSRSSTRASRCPCSSPPPTCRPSSSRRRTPVSTTSTSTATRSATSAATTGTSSRSGRRAGRGAPESSRSRTTWRTPGSSRASYYNPNVIGSGDVPRTWKDLLQPKWQGKVYMGIDTGTAGFIGLLDRIYGDTFIDQLSKRSASAGQRPRDRRPGDRRDDPDRDQHLVELPQDELPRPRPAAPLGAARPGAGLLPGGLDLEERAAPVRRGPARRLADVQGRRAAALDTLGNACRPQGLLAVPTT